MLPWMRTLSFLLFFAAYGQAGPLNLEDAAQDFVLETKRIIIPEFPHAFNPSIIRWNDTLLMSFRVIPNPKNSFVSWLYLIELDNNFEPIMKPQRLWTRDKHSKIPSRAEDGRLISIKNKLYIIYSDNEDPLISKGGFRMYIAQILCDNGLFYLDTIERISSFPGNNIKRREKNWTPFIYKNKLLLAYSLNPHIIFQPLRGTNSAQLKASSRSTITWPCGELRGGTCALFDKDHYLAFFHSACKMATIHSHNKEVLHYVMGAYLFSANPPFAITHISPEPIVGKTFYSGKEYHPYWKPVHVVFPCGFIQDEKYIWISYGRQDHELWVAKLDKEKLYASLVPVRHVELE